VPVFHRYLFILGCAASATGTVAKPLPPLSDAYLAWVAKGSAPAIASAKKEMGRRDAGDAEDLGDALGRAMQAAPRRVLPLVDSGPGFDANWLCAPFIGEDVSLGRARAILRKSRMAVERVHDARLAKARAVCLRNIREGEATLARKR
jgi:hypothetical protein